VDDGRSQARAAEGTDEIDGGGHAIILEIAAIDDAIDDLTIWRGSPAQGPGRR
jgi:hypothetical protein